MLVLIVVDTNISSTNNVFVSVDADHYLVVHLIIAYKEHANFSLFNLIILLV